MGETTDGDGQLLPWWNRVSAVRDARILADLAKGRAEPLHGSSAQAQPEAEGVPGVGDEKQPWAVLGVVRAVQRGDIVRVLALLVWLGHVGPRSGRKPVT